VLAKNVLLAHLNHRNDRPGFRMALNTSHFLKLDPVVKIDEVQQAELAGLSFRNEMP
jgi:hypothetical protein